MPPVLTTERLVLRLANERDAEAIVAYYRDNREFLAPYEPLRPPGFYTKRFWELQARRSHEDFRAGVAVRLFLFRRDDPGAISGYISLTGITRGPAQFCFMGYNLAEHEQGKGLMSEALREVIHMAFADLSLHRIQANYMPHNQRSGRLLRRLGFTVEGYARDYLMIHGRWEDHVLTSLTNENWHGGEGR
ncbi:GNAT family N-acetyltransferase [bacterium]|nr:GNAT family N-acetyltransferase [bacterium]